MKTTWIIAADSSRARILQVMDRDARLAEVEDFQNPDGRAHDRDLMEDGHARFHGTSGPGSDREEMAPSEHATELFAKRVCDYLDQARNAHRYDRLHLVAPPKFLGQLRKELGSEVQKLVTDELPKDLSWLSTRDIESRYFRKSK
jgi:protein required for attachment to host cells